MAEVIAQKELEEAFKLFDSDGDGLITSKELRGIIEKVGGRLSAGESEELLRLADQGGNGGIVLSQFTQLWAAIRGPREEEAEIREEFEKLDSDNSGFITREEMLAIIAGCQHFNGDKMAEAEKCVAEIDVDEDGRVSYPEFLLVWKHIK